MRKTIKVEDFKNTINAMLKDTVCPEDVRRGLIASLESVLLETGNYNGFKYLLEHEVPEGQLPGINYEVNTSGNFVPCEDYNKRFFNTDCTRIQYY